MEICSSCWFFFIFERERELLSRIVEIRPSAVVGTRSKVALQGEAYAWVPDLRSLDKLREVGVSPYLGFILYLSTLLMFEFNETVRGRLISPKSWDRIVIIFEASNGQPVQFTDCL